MNDRRHDGAIHQVEPLNSFELSERNTTSLRGSSNAKD